MPRPGFFVLSVPCVGEEVLTIHSWYLRVVAVGRRRPSPRITGPRQHCAGNARLLAAPNRYLAAGSTTGSCLLESADDGTAFAKDYPDQVAERPCRCLRSGLSLRRRGDTTRVRRRLEDVAFTRKASGRPASIEARPCRRRAPHPEVTRAGAMTRRPTTTHTVPFLPQVEAQDRFLDLLTATECEVAVDANASEPSFLQYSKRTDVVRGRSGVEWTFGSLGKKNL